MPECQVKKQQRKEKRIGATQEVDYVQRVSIATTEPSDTVVARIDAAIGHPDMVAFRKSFSAAQNEAEKGKSCRSCDAIERSYGVCAVRPR
jgi:hypothetical protein